MEAGRERKRERMKKERKNSGRTEQYMDKNETGFEESEEQIKVAEREKGNGDKRQKERNRGGTGNDDNSSGIQPESSGTRSNGKPQRLPCPFPPPFGRQTNGWIHVGTKRLCSLQMQL